MENTYMLGQTAPDIDFADGAARFFGNEELFIAFLKHFPEDDNYRLFLHFMMKKQYGAALAHISALKGLCANLSILALYYICADIENKIRTRHFPVDLKKIKSTYKRIEKTIVSI